MTIPLSLLAGALTWTGAEYLLHRFIGHGPRRAAPEALWQRLTPRGFLGAFNDEHLRHHADARYFAPTSQKVAAALATVTSLSLLGTLLAGGAVGCAFAVGFSVTYASYEIIHRRIHTHPPRGRYTRWQRRHHLMHHFKTPHLNHGVTSPLWDVVARTERQAPAGEALRVPRNLAPDWLVGADGAVRSEFANDYVIPTGAAPAHHRPAAGLDVAATAHG
jgi:Fatty acid hydroxylase superfamily